MVRNRMARLARLEGPLLVVDGPCPRAEYPTAIVVRRVHFGQPAPPWPPVPPDAPRCECCGGPHVQLIEEVIVTNRDEVELLKRATR